ncbi:interleukin-31 receptor subunit alpha [Salarias fasciatus]|uniref:Interleukin-31 receptor subunit alpha-like n=1 Tax=Salarias fasciatus TaxID=181472 RepID=A0A672JQB6_SALFA|nr:interleukin-31 receptor subunit alpha-like [Salarias fasciatus]
METFNPWSSLQGYAIFMFLWMINKGSACEPPSSPLCFRRNSSETIYKCEWNQTGNQADVTYDLHFNFAIDLKNNFKETSIDILAEQLITERITESWVEVHTGNSSCRSPRRSAVLGQTVKFDPPNNITVTWIQNSLILKWSAAEKFPALAEIWFRNEDHTETWDKAITNATLSGASTYQAIIRNLLKNSFYQVQIRHQCKQVKEPLWSNWSQVVIVPAELEHKPNVRWKEQLLDGKRKVILSWESVPKAASVRGIRFTLNDTQSSRGCPCKKKIHTTNSTHYTMYVSNSAVNISVIATNAAGSSPLASVQLPAVQMKDLKVCNKTLLGEKLEKSMCLEWYELDEDSVPTNGSFQSRKREKARINETVQDHIRYLYFEQRCHKGKPQTVKTCFFYKEEGAPNKEPQDFRAFGEMHTSVNLSWKAIPLKNQRGVLTHYNLCWVKSNSQDVPPECRNISASETKHRLDKLTPGTKYSISLTGVTRVGKGPEATVTVNTKPEKPVNVWLSFGLLIIFFLVSIMCTFVFKRIKNKLFPPVPRPFIPNFTSHQPETPVTAEHKEEVHDLMLQQLHPESRTVCEETEEVTVLGGQWDDRSGEDMKNDNSDSGGSDEESLSADTLKTTSEREGTDLEQMDSELAILIYRNGLVFDVKTDSS